MPELPEVETIRRALEPQLLGRRLAHIDVLERVHLLKNCTPEALQERLVGRRLTALGRRGKFLIFEFGPWAMVLHLRMSGRLLWTPARHTRLVLQFRDGEGRGRALYLDDARRFASLYLVRADQLDEQKPLKDLGLEPLTPAYTWAAFRRLLDSEREVKRLLLDQTRLAGLGNIYACEALFEAGVHPRKPARALSPEEAKRLFEAIPRVLRRALRAGGTSFDRYRRPDGSIGRFQEEFRVYGRAGAPCPRCGAPIERITQGGRSSFFCPRCQPF